ncbi:hypothetical protein SADUNF_Sadunf10G0064500 [Salix dunnii]|uniref:Bifunctional inhibitor/plant lipid transfer protein/seed storage helical domain-containing protein n=1 Tax=Salix dunnii TaxID=1413687 RepID=A0A835JP29_9ROSI|nr:hypothetical protein SADUNF_Sadunf10G0064500 [Salix dunnii]
MRYMFGDACSKIRVKLRSSSVETMSCDMRAWVVTVLLVLVASNVFICDVYAGGECGKTPIRSAAASLSPCLGAAGNARAAVPPTCCSKVAALIKTAPKCLCAIMLSPLAKQAGIKPGIALTIPKRCNIKNRQAGKKCGIAAHTALQMACVLERPVARFLSWALRSSRVTRKPRNPNHDRVHAPMSIDGRETANYT